MRKTALLTGVAGLFLMTAPAFAQDGTAPTTPPPASPPASPPVAEPSAEPATLALSPGAKVLGSDGAVLGTLENARSTPAGQELLVRGADGQLRAVPVTGIRQEGADVVVGWSGEQYQAAPAVADPATPAAPAVPPAPATPAVPATPDLPAVSAVPPMPDMPDMPEAPTVPPTPTPPTVPPVAPTSAPAPGEGQEPMPDQPGA